MPSALGSLRDHWVVLQTRCFLKRPGEEGWEGEEREKELRRVMYLHHLLMMAVIMYYKHGLTKTKS